MAGAAPVVGAVVGAAFSEGVSEMSMEAAARDDLVGSAAAQVSVNNELFKNVRFASDLELYKCISEYGIEYSLAYIEELMDSEKNQRFISRTRPNLRLAIRFFFGLNFSYANIENITGISILITTILCI